MIWTMSGEAKDSEELGRPRWAASGVGLGARAVGETPFSRSDVGETSPTPTLRGKGKTLVAQERLRSRVWANRFRRTRTPKAIMMSTAITTGTAMAAAGT